jgi:hypothetical protein
MTAKLLPSHNSPQDCHLTSNAGDLFESTVKPMPIVSRSKSAPIAFLIGFCSTFRPITQSLNRSP